MEKRNIIYFIFTIALIFALSGCEAVAELFHGPKQEETSIYAAGYETLADGTTRVATVWQDGVSSLLTSSASEVLAITVSNSDVYVVGYMGSPWTAPRLWKNGIGLSFGYSPSYSSPTYSSYARAITVVGSDIYVLTDGTMDSVRVWKNSKVLFSSNRYGQTSGIAMVVVGSDVYLLEINRNSSPISSRVTKNGSHAGFEKAAVGGKVMVVVGSDIYVAGIEGNVAKVWKNGMAKALSFGTSSANAMTVIGSDVYVAGSEGKIAKIWINDVGTNLTDGAYEASANALVVLGSDIYAAGYEKNTNGIDVAKVWKNGVETVLTDGYTNARVNALAVVRK
jgi:hypothetical protein